MLGSPFGELCSPGDCRRGCGLREWGSLGRRTLADAVCPSLLSQPHSLNFISGLKIWRNKNALHSVKKRASIWIVVSLRICQRCPQAPEKMLHSVRKCQSTSVRSGFTPTRMLVIKRTIPSVVEGVEKLDPSFAVWKTGQLLRKTFRQFLKK